MRRDRQAETEARCRLDGSDSLEFFHGTLSSAEPCLSSLIFEHKKTDGRRDWRVVEQIDIGSLQEMTIRLACTKKI